MIIKDFIEVTTVGGVTFSVATGHILYVSHSDSPGCGCEVAIEGLGRNGVVESYAEVLALIERSKQTADFELC
jgi:hypothetical protein